MRMFKTIVNEREGALFIKCTVANRQKLLNITFYFTQNIYLPINKLHYDQFNFCVPYFVLAPHRGDVPKKVVISAERSIKGGWGRNHTHLTFAPKLTLFIIGFIDSLTFKANDKFL